LKKIPQLSDAPDDADAAAARDAMDGVASDEPVTVPTDDAAPLARGAEVPGAGGSSAGEPRSDRRPGTSGGKAPKSRGARKPARGPARRFARERALQALYQWDMADAESSSVRREFIERQDMSRVDVDYFERLFRGVSHDVEKVDASLADALDRPLAEVDPIERAVLRVAAFELADVLETPARVVINEGVEITKRFGADNGHRYVNGVLDRLAAVLRPLEMRRG